jgi:hypothetical protein
MTGKSGLSLRQIGAPQRSCFRLNIKRRNTLEESYDYIPSERKLEEVKKSLGINHSNDEMTDEEIRKVIFAMMEECGIKVSENGEPKMDYCEVNAFLTIGLFFFPRFFEKYHLSQSN